VFERLFRQDLQDYGGASRHPTVTAVNIGKLCDPSGEVPGALRRERSRRNPNRDQVGPGAQVHSAVGDGGCGLALFA